MTSLISASTLTTGQVQTLDSVRAHALPSDAMIFASATEIAPANQNTGSYAMVESANASITLTTTGSVPAVTQSPFADVYKEGSIYFNGTTGNYITTTASGLISSPWGTVGMTIEAWVYYNTFTGASVVAGGTPTALQCPTLFGFQQATGAGSALGFGSNVNGYVTFFYNCNGPIQSVTSQTQLAANTWNHIAMTCSTSGQIFLFVNGVQSQIVANRNGALQAAAYYETVQSGGGIASGIQPAFGQFNSVVCNAYMADFRIIAGAPIYTGSTGSYATFTVPPAPLTIAATGTTHMLVRAGQNSPTIQNGALTFDRGLKQFMNFGPQTFNIVTQGFTAVWKGQLTGTVGSYERIFEFGTGTSTGNILALRNASTNKLWFIAYPSTGGSSSTIASVSSLSQGVTYVLAFRYNPVTQILDLWINGARDIAASILTSTLVADRTVAFTYLSRASDAAPNGQFTSNTLAVYNRSLSDSEIYQSYLALSTPAPLKTLEIGDINGTPAMSIAGDGRVSIQAIGQTSAVTAWPPAAMTGYDTVINGQVYKARASTELGASNLTWYSFNKDGFSTYWTSQNSVYSTSLPYGYTGTYTTTDANGSVYPGEWVQIQLASSIVLSSYSVTSGGFPSTRSPGKFFLLGSRDGNNWFPVDSRSGATYTPPYVNTYTVTQGQAFGYYRIIINQTSGGGGVAELGELILNGTADTAQPLTIAQPTKFTYPVQTPALTGIQNDGVYVPQDFSSSALNIPAYVVSNTATTANTVTYSGMGPFAEEGSLYFPGGREAYVSLPAGTPPCLTANTLFTFETWIYLVSLPGVIGPAIFNYGGSGDNFGLYFTSTGGAVLNGYMVSSAGTGLNCLGGTITQGAWTHVAFTWDGANMRTFINGALQATTAFTTLRSVAGSAFTLGRSSQVSFSSALGPNMYLTNTRLVAGAALYTAAFTPPTGPLQPIQGVTQAGLPYGTVLLLRNAPAPGRVLTQKFAGANSGSVLAFPPAAMTGYATVLNAGYGQGTYVASASSEYVTSYSWQSFNKANSQWSSAYLSDYSGTTPYGATGTAPKTVDINGNSYSGAWLQIQQPSSIVVSNYIINSPFSYGAAAGAPAVWVILGSRDGVNWFLVDRRSGISFSASYQAQTFTISSSQAYTYFRLVITNISGSQTATELGEWTLNGTIESVNITADGRVGLGVVNPTRALEVAGDIVCSGTVSSGTGGMFRNALYNGDMIISQRATSFNFNNTNRHVLDRWFVSQYGAAGVGTVSQIQSGLANFSNALQLTTTTTAIGNWYISQSLETRDVVRFQGQPVTLSFWARVPTQFTSTAWQVYVAYNSSIDAQLSSIAQTTTAGASLFPTFTSAWSYYQVSGFIATSAQSLAVQFFNYGNIVNGATIEITGVQLEKGTVATPFEVRPYVAELALCQRYYYRLQATSTYSALCQGSFIGSTTNAQCYIPFPVDMRIGADSTRFSNSAVGTFFFGSGPGASCTAIAQIGNAESTRGNQIRFTTSVTQTTGVGCIVEANNTTTAFLAFDAEL